MALTNFRASPIPNPPVQWDPQYMRQVIRVLEIYFNQLDSNAPNYAQTYTADYFYGSGIYLTTPYGQFTSSTDQTAANTYTAYALTYDVSDFTDGITLSNSSRLTVPVAGIYQIQYSIQFTSDSTSTELVDIWLRKNGTDVADTNSQFSLPARKSAGVPSALIAVTPIMIELVANDYLEILWHVSSTSVSVQHLPAVAASAGVTPAIPATPSAIVQVQFISHV